MVINHNMSAINAQRQMYKTSTAQAKSTEKLSSGLRINRAGDDAAGLAISEKMRGQISGLNQASRNAQDGISLIQTAEGALDEQHSMLQRMRELAVQAENDTNTDEDREQIQSEIEQLQQEITAITEKTEFNTKKLLNGNQKITSASSELKAASAGLKQATVGRKQASAALKTATAEKKVASANVKYASAEALLIKKAGMSDGSAAQLKASVEALKASAAGLQVSAEGLFASAKGLQASAAGLQASAYGMVDEANDILKKNTELGKTTGGLTFQVGANAGQTITVGINSMTANDLGVADINVTKQTTNDGVLSNISKIDRAINLVSTQRSKLGAVQNRLEHTIANVDNAAENLQASESRIRDTDMAKEMMTYTSKNVLSQATQAMLAQANQKPNQVLSLLQ